ncbi:P-loop containing nucleoside triphosphate hydrolase protein [Mycena amicta]|nr:P-loop containing nucleoside triphosphate hydrolase protein [Mycena amicta]
MDPTPGSRRPKRFFHRKPAGTALDAKDDNQAKDKATAKQERKVPPVSFFALFRFATRLEILLNILGIIAAGAAGGVTPVLSIFFGSLTQDFVAFTLILTESRGGSAEATAQLPAAAAHFRHTAGRNSTWLTIIGIGVFFTTWIYMHTWILTAELSGKRIRERYLQAVLRQDPTFFDDVGAGEVVTRIQTDTHLVQTGISEKVPLCVFFLAQFVSGFVIAFVRSWRMALVLTTMFPFMILVGALMGKFAQKYTEQSLKHVAEGGTLAEETISSIRTAHAFGTQEVLARMYDGFIGNARRVDVKTAVVTGLGLAAFYFAIFSSYGLAFSWGVTLVNRGEGDAGTIVTVFMSIMTGTFSLVVLGTVAQPILLALGAAGKLFETIDRVPLIDSSSPLGLKPLPPVPSPSSPISDTPTLSLTNVTFAYPSRPDVRVLNDVSLSFTQGTTTALVGSSGSGKSTVLALIERFYDVGADSGSVKLDGVDVHELNVKFLRSQIGYVAQEPVLFDATVRENIAYGLVNSPLDGLPAAEKHARIEQACILANADGFVRKLPKGYDTLVGERGFLLSGGQKQRIAIARAVVKDPRILLLDEATSALDGHSEGVVQRALDNASAGRTTITIAHRLSTIRHADKICVMGEGRVLEEGTHEELLATGGSVYAQLVQAQTLRDTHSGSDSTPEKLSDTVTDPDDAVPVEKTGLLQVISADTKAPELGLVDLWLRLTTLNRDSWRKYMIGAVFALLNAMVFPAYGVIYAKGIVAFSDPDPRTRRHLGDRTALYMFIVAIGSSFVISMQNYLFASGAADFTAKLRSVLFRAVLGQKIEFFDKQENNTGALTANLSDYTQKVKGLMGMTLGSVIECLASLAMGWIIGLIFVWKLGLVCIACSPFLFLTGYVRLRVIIQKDEINRRAHLNTSQIACEAASAYRTVAALTAEDEFLSRYSASLLEPLRTAKRAAVWSAMLYAFSQTIAFWVIALAFYYGSVLVSRQECSTLGFFITLEATIFGSMNASNVFSFAPDLSAAKTAGSAIMRLLSSGPGIPPYPTGDLEKEQQEQTGHVQFHDVHFSYPTRPQERVLRGLTFEARPGEYVALVGASGCGKSTIIQLVERFYETEGARISLDGTSIDEIDIQEYRSRIALVSQEPTLYAGTIKFNLLLGALKPHEEVTQAEIEKVCTDANILEFILGLPQGFETEVGGKGSQLSGGQKQRIAIARALMRDPKVLLLDEATSALDSSSEKVVQLALDNAAAGRTTIAIAHRLSTIQNADRIYFIKEGVISECGTHDELLEMKGDYAGFVRMQGLETTRTQT